MSKPDIDKEFLVTTASLIAKGLIEEDEQGMKLTKHGYKMIYSKWMELSGENRILYGLFFKAVQARRNRREE